MTITDTVAASAALQPFHHLAAYCWADQPTAAAPDASCWALATHPSGLCDDCHHRLIEAV